MLNSPMLIIQDELTRARRTRQGHGADLSGLAHEGDTLERSLLRAQLAATLDSSPDFVALCDVEGRFFYLNAAAHEMLGLDAGVPVSDLHLADAHPAWANLLVLGEGIQMARLDGQWRGESALINQDGEEVPVSEWILANTRSDGHCEYLAVVAHSIAEVKEAEAAQRAGEKFFRNMVEGAAVGLWSADLDGRITFANPCMARWLGASAEELVGEPIAAFLLEDTDRSDCAGPDGGAGLRAFRLRRKDGKMLRAALATSPFYDANERFAGTLGTVTRVKSV